MQTSLYPFHEYISPAYKKIKSDSIRLCDWQHLSIYTAMIDDKWCVVSEGIAGKGYDDIKLPEISTDGNLYVFAAKIDGKWKLIVSEKGDKNFSPRLYDIPYDDIGSIIISPDKKIILFTGKGNDKYRLMILTRLKDFYKKEGDINIKLTDQHYESITAGIYDSNRLFEFGIGELYDNISKITFDKNRHFTYVAKRNKACYVILDGEVVDKYEDIDLLSFSKNGLLIYTAKNDGLWQLHVGDKISKKYESISKPVLSRDENRIAFIAKMGDKWSIVIDDIPQKSYDELTQPVFSPNGTMITYAARTGTKWRILIDNYEMKEYDYILQDRIYFWSEYDKRIDNRGTLISPVLVSYIGVTRLEDQVTKKLYNKVYDVKDSIYFEDTVNENK